MNKTFTYIAILTALMVLLACGETSQRLPPPTVTVNSPLVVPAPFPSPTQAPDPTPPTQVPYTEQQIRSWNRKLSSTDLLSIPEMTSVKTKKRPNRIEVGIDCESNRESVSQRVPELISGSDIPPEAIRIVVSPRVRFGEDPESFECAPPEVIDPATGISSPGFGRLFINRDGPRKINVYMLEPDQEKAEALALEVVGRETLERYLNVRVIQGQYTWEQLLEWYHLINDSNVDIQGADFVKGTFIAESSLNRLTVEIRRDENRDVETVIEDFLKRIDAPREAFVLCDPMCSRP